MQEVVLRVAREDGAGAGIGFLEGKTAFIPGALEGEAVRARVRKSAKRVLHLELLHVEEPSAQRREAPCPYVRLCGGCTMQHMDYARTVAQKERRVVDCLSRIGGVAPGSYELTPLCGMDDPWRYRNKAVCPIQGGEIGFYRRESHDLVPIADCLLQPLSFARALSGTRAYLAGGGRGRSLLMRTAADGGVLLALEADAADGFAPRAREAVPELRGALRLGEGGAERLWGSDHLDDELLGVRTRVPALSFRQVNRAQAGALYERALHLLRLTGDERVADAYCGAGILTQLLARRCREAVGIEIVPEAIREATQSAQRMGAGNVSFLTGSCEALLPGVACDVLVLDPPRKGCSPAVIAAALAARPEKILYISCDPATLARDVKLFAQGGYRTKAVAPVDMFPWTAHVETALLLQRADI